MSGLFDYSKEIDDLICQFPGNRALQEEMGLIDVGEVPFESLSEIPWHQLELIGLVRVLIDGEFEASNFVFDGEKAEETYRQFMKLTNRILMMELIKKSLHINDPEKKLKEAFIDLSLPGYYRKVGELSLELAIFRAKNRVEKEKFQSLVGELEEI